MRDRRDAQSLGRGTKDTRGGQRKREKSDRGGHVKLCSCNQPGSMRVDGRRENGTTTPTVSHHLYDVSDPRALLHGETAVPKAT